MARPKKWRKVCCLPASSQFGPFDVETEQDHFVTMNIEEYETIRLIDLEGLTQEDCAKQMDIARTTVQGIYNDARKKLAESLVLGKRLRIEGGNYKLCESDGKPCRGCGCRKRRALMMDSSDT
ncbi:DUF134 domain-containing protein [Bacillus tuaregi]|uniref:DUF134 domain-containing protein n=1 Tax=Bacillus tuaregi TaxID=1816695 RepID=UPI0008F887D6|nr:DUF134 domain-containing protein [Bacillus tuaregi]